jgi:hypothetical protein
VRSAAAVEEQPLSPEEATTSDEEEKILEEVTGTALYSPEAEELETLHPPTAPSEDEQEAARVPVPLLVIVVAILLGLTTGRDPALLWLGFFVPIMAIRLMMRGMFKVSDGQRIAGAIFFLVQLACLGVIGFELWTEGCKSINVWAVSGVAAMVLVSSFLPSPSALMATGAGLAVVLFLWYSNIGTPCEPAEPGPAAEQQRSGRPSVRDPGHRRTNDDGSWPRRPPR